MSLDNNKYLMENEDRINRQALYDILEIVNYVRDEIHKVFPECEVDYASYYEYQAPSHVHINYIGLGVVNIELASLTRDNIDTKIEAAIDMLKKNLYDSKDNKVMRITQ